jgi:hypothetical protein
VIQQEEVRDRMLAKIQLEGMTDERERVAVVTARLLLPVVMKIIVEEVRAAEKKAAKKPARSAEQ